MRRTWSIIFSILIGALAVGIGMGIFLKLANDDRERLAAQAEQAKQDSDRLQAASRKTIEEAQDKLSSANEEVKKAQAAMERIAAERDLMARAEPLAAPKDLKDWREVVSLPLGVSFKYPATAFVEANTAAALTLGYLAPGKATSTAGLGERWFSLTPYDSRLEGELVSGLGATSSAVFLVRGHVLDGWRGSVSGTSQDVYLLKILEQGEATGLIWLKSVGSKKDRIDPVTILSTLDFNR